MARLSKEQWEAARARWEGEPDLTFGQLAKDLDVSRPAVSKRAADEGWEKGAPPKVSTTPKVTKVTEVTGEVSTDGKEAKAPAQPESGTPATGRLSSADWELMTRRPRGRPPEYRDEFVDEIIRFFDITVESVVDVDVVDKDGKVTVQKQVVVNTFPTLTRFASKIGVTRETLHDWATAKNTDGSLKRPEFSYAHARAKDLQDALLVEGGMSGRYEGRFATMAAKNIIGWKDQIETTSEVTVKTASTEELDAAYQAGMAQMAANRDKVLARNRAAALVDLNDAPGE